MIYFIEDPVTYRIKIGTTIRLSSRLAALKAKHGPRLQVLGVAPGSYADERALHERFQLLRDEGEWFKPYDLLIAFIDQETQPWDGIDEIPLPKNVSQTDVDRAIVGKAKLIATHRGISVAELLSELLRAPVDKSYAQMLRELDPSTDR